MKLPSHVIDRINPPDHWSALPRRWYATALVLSGALVVGCGSKPPPPVESAPTPTAKGPQTAPSNTKAEPMPNSPTASSVFIDDAILKACGIQVPKAFFAFDSANVQKQDTTVLDQIATCFISGPLKGRSMKLVGHADPRGETEYNFVLGNSRADAVGGYIRSKGLDKSKMETSSRGELDATGTDESGWAKDRRVDILLVQ